MPMALPHLAKQGSREQLRYCALIWSVLGACRRPHPPPQGHLVYLTEVVAVDELFAWLGSGFDALTVAVFVIVAPARRRNVDHKLYSSPGWIGKGQWRYRADVAGNGPVAEGAWGSLLAYRAAHGAATDGAASFGELSADKAGASWNAIRYHNSARRIRSKVYDPDAIGEIRAGAYAARTAVTDGHIGRWQLLEDRKRRKRIHAATDDMQRAVPRFLLMRRSWSCFVLFRDVVGAKR
jgi:hypothetical protein